MSTVAPTYEEFVEAFPAFSSLTEPVVERQLSLSTRLLSSSAWGDFYSDGVSLDAAHNLVLNDMIRSPGDGVKGTMGPVTSVSGAGISTSFASPEWDKNSQSENWYIKTSYGQQFLRLRNIVISCAALSV